MNRVYNFLNKERFSSAQFSLIIGSIVFIAVLLLSAMACTNDLKAQMPYPEADSTLAHMYTDSLVKGGYFYVTEIKSGKQMRATHPVKDNNRIVGSYTPPNNLNTYNVREGSRGGWYIWRLKGDRAKEPGAPYIYYLNDDEKLKVDK